MRGLRREVDTFRCRLGYYEYRVTLIYLDHILIYSEEESEHKTQVIAVLIQLRKFGLHIKLEKCEFSVRQIMYLGFLVSGSGVSMDLFRVESIANWPEPRSFRDVQVFIEFCNFYRRFIYAFSAVVTELTELLKGSKRGTFTQKL